MKTTLVILLMKLFLVLNIGSPEHAVISLLEREGAKPKTVYSIPHIQKDQESSEEMFSLLEKWVFSLPYIKQESSIGSFSSALGAMISKEYKGNINAFIGREWTHIHKETGYGSMHALLTGPNAYEVVRKGWGEYHPMNRSAKKNSKQALVMVYSPRNNKDLEEIKKILISSYNYVLDTDLKIE